MKTRIIEGAARLKQKLTEGKGFVENLSIDEQVIISKLPTDTKYFHFINIEFRKGILFENIKDIKAGIYFINCSGNTLAITNCHISIPSDNTELPEGSGLILDNCKFEDVNLFENINFSRGVTIKNESIIDHLIVRDSKFKLDGIRIEKSTINKNFDVISVDSEYGITCDDSFIKCKLRINDLIGGSFATDNTKYEKDLHFDKNKIYVIFNNSIFEDDVYFRGNEIESFTSFNDDFYRSLDFQVINEFKGGFLNEVYIHNSKAGEGIEFSGFDTDLKKINIPITNLLNGTIKFSNFRVKETLISGLNSNANLIFQGMSFKNLQIEDFHNKAGLTFANCKGSEDSKLTITDSHLGNSIFLSFDFESFQKIEIESSVLHDIELSNPILPNSAQIISDEIDLKKLNSKKREVFRQLRHAVSKKGDSILTKELRAEELELFRKEKSNTSIFNRDRIILWLSSTNDMGLNWSKPIFILLGFTFIFHLFVVAAHSDTLTFVNPLCISEVDWSKTFSVYLSYGAYFWSMFNPIRNLQSILGESAGALNGWVYFWDGLHRIILAFFIFQIVSAFRKYL